MHNLKEVRRMGEYAEMMIGGACCERCGNYIGNEVGYPQMCEDCHDELTASEGEE